MPTEDDVASPHRARHLLLVLAAVAAGAVLAALAVWLLRNAGATPQLQRIVAFVCVGSALLLAMLRGRVGPDDGLSAAATLIAVSAVAVAALTYVGSVDKDPQFGCINSHGPLDATVSGNVSVVYSRPTAASDPEGLLLRGCEVHAVSWCVGAIHEDAIEAKVFDVRWLELESDKGFVPVGRTVSQRLPDGDRDDDCTGGIAPPKDITFTLAVLDRETGDVGLTATTKGAAFIGFAIRRSDDRWQRLGWDYEADDDQPVVLPPPAAGARAGDEVVAVACLGYQQPAESDGVPVTQRAPLELARGLERDPKRGATAQPLGKTASDAACNSAVPTPPVPYTQGVVPAS